MRLERWDPKGGGQIKVFYEVDGVLKSEDYDTVLFSIGRYAMTKDLQLQNTGINTEYNGKIKVNDCQ